MAKKYHVNPETFKEGKCGAAVPSKCPFYRGRSESNHFATMEEASQYAQAKLQEQHGMFSRKPSTAFARRRGQVISDLKKYCPSYAKNLNEDSVSSQEQMLDEWFNGSSVMFDKFQKTVSSDMMNDKTKKSVVKMIVSGMDVQHASGVEDLQSVHDDKVSGITLIDDSEELFFELKKNKKVAV